MAFRRPLVLLAVATLAGAGFVLGGRTCQDAAGSPPRMILLLTIDTLRRDAVGAFANTSPDAPSATPRMDALARAGLLFLDARSPVPLTLPAHVTMLAGLPPAVTGVRLNAYDRLPGPEARGFPLLAERLRAAGWRTGAFVSAQPLARSFGLDQGFEVYDDGLEELAAGAAGSVPERAGAETCARALAFVRSASASDHVFLWVHLFEPHAPYLSYADDVAAADGVVGRLLDGLHAAGRGEDAAILLTSDHGEMLGELGEPTHGFLLGDAVLRVPFALRVPGRAPATRTDPVDLADVAPTLAALAGVDWPEAASPFAGRDVGTQSAPATRVRVAESLYAHHRFRWAQVIAAVGPAGTLVDTGGTRLGWLEPAPSGEPQRARALVTQAPDELGAAIATYRAGEQQERMGRRTPAGPYEGAGLVAPFLSDAENARLPDPYREIPRVVVLHQIKAQARRAGGLAPRALRTLLEQVAHQVKLDPANPEVHFLEGLVLQLRSIHEHGAGEPERVAVSLTAAEAAFGRAFELGRQDPHTLALWAGVNAMGRARLALERLAAWMPKVGADCQCYVLQARLHLELEQTDEAAEACDRARSACRSPAEKATMTKTCR